MKTAAEMKQIAEQNLASTHAVEEMEVTSKIEQAAAKGGNAVILQRQLSVYITVKLEKNGYNVKYNHSSYQRETSTTTISWG